MNLSRQIIELLISPKFEFNSEMHVYVIAMSRFFLLLLMTLSLNLSAQFEDIIFDNYIYADYIKSVTFTHRGLQTSMPVIDFNSRYQGSLQLGFDDLEGGFKTYLYRIIHCDKDWYPSELEEIEYLDGFNYEEIDNFGYSANAYSEYTHYDLYLPNDDLMWTISGNYLLVIYDEEYEVPVLSRRFMVAENQVNIGYNIMKPKNVMKLNTHQEIELTINHKNIYVSRPRTELFVTVVQNGNWNSALTNLQGTYERGDIVYFDLYDFIVFPALKEFRNFDIRSLNYTTEFVNAIDRDKDVSTVLLDLNKKRYTRNFLSEIDANGFFVLDNFDYGDGTVTSEYANVIFTLESEKQYDEDLYIIGAFSDWQARKEYKLDYDPTRSLYIGEAFFKQGYYDYMFALQDKETGYLDMETIEGSWYETENDYMVLVYFREFGSFYDRLIGVQNFNSNARQ